MYISKLQSLISCAIQSDPTLCPEKRKLINDCTKWKMTNNQGSGTIRTKILPSKLSWEITEISNRHIYG